MREEQELANIFGHFVSSTEANSVRIVGQTDERWRGREL